MVFLSFWRKTSRILFEIEFGDLFLNDLLRILEVNFGLLLFFNYFFFFIILHSNILLNSFGHRRFPLSFHLSLSDTLFGKFFRHGKIQNSWMLSQAIKILHSIFGLIQIFIIFSDLDFVVFISFAMFSFNLFLFEVILVNFQIVKFRLFLYSWVLAMMRSKSFGFETFIQLLLLKDVHLLN